MSSNFKQVFEKFIEEIESLQEMEEENPIIYDALGDFFEEQLVDELMSDLGICKSVEQFFDERDKKK